VNSTQYAKVNFFSSTQATAFKQVVLPALSKRKGVQAIAFLGDKYGHNAAMVHSMLGAASKAKPAPEQPKFIVVHKDCQIPQLGYTTSQTQLPEGMQLRAIRAPGGYVIPLPENFMKRTVQLKTDPTGAFQLIELGVNVIFCCGCIIPSHYDEPGQGAKEKGERVIAMAAEFLPYGGFLITSPLHSSMRFAIEQQFNEVYYNQAGAAVYQARRQRSP